MAQITSFMDSPEGFEALLLLALCVGLLFITKSPRFKKTWQLDMVAFIAMFSYVASGIYHLRYGQLDGYTNSLDLPVKHRLGGAWYFLVLLTVFMAIYAAKFPQVLDFSKEKRDIHIYTTGVVFMSAMMWLMVLFEVILITPSFPMDFREIFITWATIIGGATMLIYYFVMERK